MNESLQRYRDQCLRHRRPPLWQGHSWAHELHLPVIGGFSAG